MKVEILKPIKVTDIDGDVKLRSKKDEVTVPDNVGEILVRKEFAKEVKSAPKIKVKKEAKK